MKMDMPKGKSKLSKLKMPGSEDAQSVDMGSQEDVDSQGGMDDSDEAGPSMDDAVNSEEEGESGEMGHDLTEVSDDDLMAEAQKRGLMKQMSGASRGKPSKSDNYSDM